MVYGTEAVGNANAGSSRLAMSGDDEELLSRLKGIRSGRPGVSPGEHRAGGLSSLPGFFNASIGLLDVGIAGSPYLDDPPVALLFPTVRGVFLVPLL